MLDDNSNWLEWGKLVVKWAEQPNTRPTSVQELNTQMTEAGVAASFSTETFKFLHMCQAHDDKTLQIFLPSVASVARRRQELATPGAWKAPIFYQELAGIAAFNVPPERKEDFMLCRIGEYSIGQCA
jgi:hypothetical protein